MTKEQIDAAIKRANQVLALTAEKSQPNSFNSSGVVISEEWSLVMNLAYDVLFLAKELKNKPVWRKNKSYCGEMVYTQR